MFWRQVGAVVLLILAVFLFLGEIGQGGALPVKLYGGMYWAFGWAAALTPVVAAYFAVLKFTHEEHKIPFINKLTMGLLVLFLAGWLHVAFASPTAITANSGGFGGNFGAMLGGAVLKALDKLASSILFFVLVVITGFLSFGKNPIDPIKSLFSLLFTRSSGEDEEEATDLAKIKSKMERRGFAINDNINQSADEPAPEPKGKPAKALLRNSMPKSAPVSAATNKSLTTASDPNWQFPGVDLLNQKQDKADPGNVEEKAESIRQTFGNFNIEVEMEGANIGPRVTQYTLRPPSNVKLTKLTALESNLALDLEASSIRMEAPIPGKKAVGIEVPNKTPATVRLSSVLSSQDWKNHTSSLGFAIGKDISGASVVEALDKMPHLLVAGQTGSGKSVMINAILTSLLYRNSPSDLKLILVDPKQVEMAPYKDIPHLLTDVITEPEKCISALKWAVAEMERRYTTLASVTKRNIAEYNMMKKEESMPYIVIVIDELADLMMVAARDVEALIVRLAQKARAVGIHLILATQRPSVDVITGLIKANVPARIAFTVASQVDSRTIIDQIGAEKLLGMGDMLFTTASMPKPKRVQGALITDDETMKVTDFLRMQQKPQYNNEIISQPVQIGGKGGSVMDAGGGDDYDDPIYKKAIEEVITAGKASTSLLQRRLRIGYGKAARFMEQMEEQGIIGQADGSRPREVLVSSISEVYGGEGGEPTQIAVEEA